MVNVRLGWGSVCCLLFGVEQVDVCDQLPLLLQKFGDSALAQGFKLWAPRARSMLTYCKSVVVSATSVRRNNLVLMPVTC
jgi:hypothetical protein